MTQPTPPAEGDREPPPAPRPGAALDAAAFEALFRAHYGRLCGMVYRLLGSRPDAEEVVQEVLHRLWERRGQVRWQGDESGEAEPDALERYCYRAVRNQAINRLRRRRRETAWYRRATLAPEADEILGPALTSTPADERLERDELLAAVGQAVDALPERCRLVFELKWRHGLRYTEIADALGITPKTVENQLLKAVKAIRLALGELRDR